MNKKAKSALAYILFFIAVMAIALFLNNAVIAFTAGDSGLGIEYRLIEDDLVGRKYTPQCLADCHLTFCVSYSGDNTLSSLAVDNQDINQYFEFLEGVDESRLKDYGTDYLATETYYINVPDYGTCQGERFNNETEKLETYDYDCKIGSHQEEKTRQVWESIKDISQIEFEKNKETCFDIWGKIEPKTNEKFAVDVIPSIILQDKDFLLSEMAWWSSSWGKTQNITITNNHESNVTESGYTIALTFNHASYVTNGTSQSDGDDIRIVYNDETELDRIECVNSSWNQADTCIQFEVQENISAGSSASNYRMYYNNTEATAPSINISDIYWFADDFEDGNLDSNRWDTSVTSGVGCHVSETGGKVEFYIAQVSQARVGMIGLSSRKDVYVDFINFKIIATDLGGEPIGLDNQTLLWNQWNVESSWRFSNSTSKIRPSFHSAGYQGAFDYLTTQVRNLSLAIDEQASQSWYINGTRTNITSNETGGYGYSWNVSVYTQASMGSINTNFTIDEIRARMYITPEPTVTLSSEKSIPSVPSLLSPTNGSGFGTIPEFNWTNSENADNYSIEIDDNVDFSSPEFFNDSIPEDPSGTTNITPTGLSMDNHYYWRVQAITAEINSSWSENRTFFYALWSITFNLTDSFTGEQIDTQSGLSDFDIECSNGLSVTDVENPYLAGDSFIQGTWKCNISDLTKYNDHRNKVLIADSDKTINIAMSEQSTLTQEEHNWLEDIYDCLYNGNCKALGLLEEINETATDIWQRVTRTDTSVVANETFISRTLDSSNNITINYTINIPFKQGYDDQELLPLRLFFWFTDEGKTECYNQDKRVGSQNRAEDPYCFPLVAEELGPNNGSVTFTVDLRPNLTDGNYNITRAIEIDPILEGIRNWINYGQEDIGEIKVSGAEGEPAINLVKTSETNPITTPSITGFVTQKITSILNGSQIVTIIGMILLTSLIAFAIVWVCNTIYKIKKIK